LIEAVNDMKAQILGAQDARKEKSKDEVPVLKGGLIPEEEDKPRPGLSGFEVKLAPEDVVVTDLDLDWEDPRSPAWTMAIVVGFLIATVIFALTGGFLSNIHPFLGSYDPLLGAVLKLLSLGFCLWTAAAAVLSWATRDWSLLRAVPPVHWIVSWLSRAEVEDPELEVVVEDGTDLDVPVPAADMRPDTFRVSKLEHTPDLAVVHVRAGFQVPYFPERYKDFELIVSKEVYTQIITPSTVVPFSKASVTWDRLYAAAKRAMSVHVDRQWTLDCSVVVQDTAYLAWLFSLHVSERFSGLPFRPAPLPAGSQ
jgi:hypothetical protein